MCIKKALDFYCSELRPTKKAAYERLENELEAINGLRRSKNFDTLPVPSYRTLVTRIDNLAPFEEKAGRYGKHKAKIAYNPIAEGVKTSRVMERVCVDHTKLDLFVVDSETGMPLGRPWLGAPWAPGPQIHCYGSRINSKPSQKINFWALLGAK